MQAAFLCSFADYVEWPEVAADGRIRILVLGEDPFGAVLDEMARERPLQTRRLEVRRSRRLDDASEAGVVFVAASEKARLAEILAALAGRSVLTVSDLEGFARQGGTIGFFVERKRVRFEINLGAAERARLRISSRLLALARIVDTAPGRGS